MNKRNCISSIVCAAVFLFFLVQSFSLPEAAGYWPKIVCSVGLALSGVEIALEGIKWGRAPSDQKSLWPLTGQQTGRCAILLGLLVLWVAGLTTIGFLVSSIAALCVLSVLFDPDKTCVHLIRDIVACILFGLLFYFLFDALGVNFPRSLLM